MPATRLYLTILHLFGSLLNQGVIYGRSQIPALEILPATSMPCGMKSAISILLAFLIAPALAGVHEIWWNITYVENASPDNLQERRVIGVNNTWP